MTQPIIGIDGQQVAARNPGLERLIEQFSAVARQAEPDVELLPPHVFEAEDRAWKMLQRLLSPRFSVRQ